MRDPLVFTPTHDLAKEMRKRGVKAETYHNFFRWRGQNDWTPERMGQKYFPRVIILDDVCTVPRPTLETFLDWLGQKGLQVVCCGDQGQPPPIADDTPHDWFRQHVDYYEEVEVEALKTLKKVILLKLDKVQYQEMRKALPSSLGGAGLWSNGGPVTCFSLAAKLCGTEPKHYSSRGTRSTFEIYRFHFSATQNTTENKTSWLPSQGLG